MYVCNVKWECNEFYLNFCFFLFTNSWLFWFWNMLLEFIDCKWMCSVCNFVIVLSFLYNFPFITWYLLIKKTNNSWNLLNMQRIRFIFRIFKFPIFRFLLTEWRKQSNQIYSSKEKINNILPFFFSFFSDSKNKLFFFLISQYSSSNFCCLFFVFFHSISPFFSPTHQHKGKWLKFLILDGQ